MGNCIHPALPKFQSIHEGKMRNLASPRAQRVWLSALIVALISWGSFAFNLFAVVNNNDFQVGGNPSESLVLDGILYSEQPGSGHMVLGHYIRPAASETDQETAHLQYFKEGNREGRFIPYESQFGLQGKFWAWLHGKTGASLAAMHALNAALFALVVTGLFICMNREFGGRAACVFAATLALSPWVVLFARDLYWMEWTWFLPMLVVFSAGRNLFRNNVYFGCVLLLYGLALLLKLLCGYEYMTAIIIAAATPVVYFAWLANCSLLMVGRHLALMALGSIVAFMLAIGLHVSTGVGLDTVSKLVQKRTYSESPEKIAHDVCRDDFWQVKEDECAAVFLRSLQVNPAAVVARMMIFRKLLPWVARAETVESEDLKQRITAAASPGISAATITDVYRMAANANWPEIAPYLIRGINTLVFLGLLVMTALRLRKLGKVSAGFAAMVALAFFAPVSWFLLAKGHSYIHGFSIVLWYLPFLPLALSALTCSTNSFSRTHLGDKELHGERCRPAIADGLMRCAVAERTS